MVERFHEISTRKLEQQLFIPSLVDQFLPKGRARFNGDEDSKDSKRRKLRAMGEQATVVAAEMTDAAAYIATDATVNALANSASEGSIPVLSGLGEALGNVASGAGEVLGGVGEAAGGAAVELIKAVAEGLGNMSS